MSSGLSYLRGSENASGGMYVENNLSTGQIWLKDGVQSMPKPRGFAGMFPKEIYPFQDASGDFSD